jgi:outer membrane protein OmpA-like peptidoglycan-associated protein
MPQLTTSSTTPDLMGIVTRQITPDVIRNAASTLHEDRGSTASALTAAVPSVLTALSDVASSDTGARHLKEVIDEKRRSSELADEDRSLFPSGGGVAGDHAATLIDDELGPRSSSIAAAVANASGIKADSAHRLMGGVASVAVAALAKTSSGMAPGALQSILRQQRGQWVSRLPGPVASLFNGHSGQAVAAVDRSYGYTDERILTGPAIRELEAPRRNWMIPVILVALALLAIPLLRGLRRPRVPTLPTAPQLTQPVPQPSATPPVETTPAPAPEATAPAPAAPAPEGAAPAPEANNVEPGSLDDMAAFLGGSGEMTPQAFAPTPLNFAFASAKPTDASTKTIDQLADLLKEHPAAAIRVESHTDNIGTAESNLSLSQARAESIKNELVDRGVDGAKIETAGLGQEMPIASNDTAEGRAKNRRSEIVVTAR